MAESADPQPADDPKPSQPAWTWRLGRQLRHEPGLCTIYAAPVGAEPRGEGELCVATALSAEWARRLVDAANAAGRQTHPGQPGPTDA